MKQFGKELVESLTQACEHAEGKPGSVRVIERSAESATLARGYCCLSTGKVTRGNQKT
jgi:hypothetical protein